MKTVRDVCVCLFLIFSLGCGLKSNSLKAKSDGTTPRGQNNGLSSRPEKVGSLPVNEQFDPSYLDFVNEQDGWLLLGSDLWRTRDGGKTWTIIYSLVPQHDNIFRFEFTDSQTGWMSRTDGVYRTSDGGNTWTEMLPGENLTAFKILPDGKRGWLAGGVDASNSKRHSDGRSIFYTEDGGNNWKRQPVDAEEDISGIYGLDAQRAWAMSDHYVFYLKNDKWVKVPPVTTKCRNEDFLDGLNQAKGMPRFGPVDIFFVNSDTGWISFSDGNKAWSLAKSTDGGLTWCDLPHLGAPESNFPPFFKRIYFYDQLNGWALDSYGALFKTIDGGNSWAKIESRAQFLDVDFLDSERILAISKDSLFRISK
jgi:photosystem II stability/assembly factor-like uncharacterized protein